ncbi:MAG: AAA family ATPase [Mycobacteriaceae bacterium]|nr:AAA family ATPase [Mycobacteriaceae bacterium]
MRETHTGIIVLVGDRAFKAKKPVLTDFLDFRTCEQRERACRREVELNSRLSPQSYLGVAHLTDPAGGPAEPLVVMLRYRDEDRLAAIVNRGPDESVRDVLADIAGVLARFHENAQRSPVIDAQGKKAAIEQRWRANMAELHRYVQRCRLDVSADSLARIQYLAAEFIAGRERLFTQRVEQGCIVDGHGDLLADDIFCPDAGPALLDCLEFDDELRYVDVIDDAAFLAMDLEFLGRKDLGDYFLQRYALQSADAAPMSLQDFYLAYRAVVRAKVDCVRITQGRSAARKEAVQHLAIAEQHLCSGVVRLALVGGNPGTGKSTLAHGLAENVGAQVISTDDVRRELRAADVIIGESGVLDSGLYSPGNVETVYQLVLDRARALLGSGRSVILDGTWRHRHLRAQAHRIAAETHSAIVEFVCVAAADLAVDRIVTRGPGNSEATPEIATAMAAHENSWETAYRVDTSKIREHSVRDLVSAWYRTVLVSQTRC